jgi:hypothetical protein
VKITVSRTGGFAGIRRTWSLEVDRDEDQRWLPLVEACPWDEVPEETTPIPDAYTYRICVDRQEASIPERFLTGPWRELVDRTREQGRPLLDPGRYPE